MKSQPIQPQIRLQYFLMRLDPAPRRPIAASHGAPQGSALETGARLHELSLCALFEAEAA